MAGLQYQKLPKLDEAQGTMTTRLSDMGALMDRQYRNEMYGIEHEYLTDSQFQNKMSTVNARYKNQWAQMQAQSQQQVQEMENMRDMVARGEMHAEQAQVASQRMVMSPEAFQAQYPGYGRQGAAPARPLSSGAVRSATTLMGEFASGAEIDKWSWEWGKSEQKKASGLIDQYVDWRSQIGYDELPPTHQRQLDQRWDAMMKSDKNFKNWFADKKKTQVIAEARALRMKSKLGRTAQLKVGVAPVRYNTSPLGRSVIKTNTKSVASPSTERKAPTAQELKATDTPAAYEQGKILGYWE